MLTFFLEKLEIFTFFLEKLEILTFFLKKLEIYTFFLEKLEILTFFLEKLELLTLFLEKLELLIFFLEKLEILTFFLEKLEILTLFLDKLEILTFFHKKLEILTFFLEKLEILTFFLEKSQINPFFNLFFRNAKKARERIENMKTEIEEAERREQEIAVEKETLDNDCKISAEKAAELKVRTSEIFLRAPNLIYVIFYFRFQEEITGKQSRYNELQAEHKEFMQRVNKIKASIVKEEQKLETIEKKLSDTNKDVPIVTSKVRSCTKFLS